MVGPNYSIFINLESLWAECKSNKEKTAALIKIAFHEGIHVIIRSFSPYKYAGFIHRGLYYLKCLNTNSLKEKMRIHIRKNSKHTNQVIGSKLCYMDFAIENIGLEKNSPRR